MLWGAGLVRNSGSPDTQIRSPHPIGDANRPPKGCLVEARAFCILAHAFHSGAHVKDWAAKCRFPH